MVSLEVYRGMNKATLDAAYNNSAAVTESASMIADWERRGKIVRSQPNARLDIEYGPRPRNRIDYFATQRKHSPLFVFIHGGYWQRNSKETFSFISEGPVAHGMNVAVIGYTLAPDASLTEIVAETHAALDLLYARATELEFDPTSIHVGGWSAGGHLAAIAAHHPHVKGVLSISGIFDLEPIEKTYINEKVQLSQNEIKTLSPIKNISPNEIPYLLFVGGSELSELRRQSEIFSSALKQAGIRASLIIPDDLNHFTILEEIARPNGTLSVELERMALSQK
ncbi:alpha/beta hydrolase [Sneathiella litorea]|uniref:Alpha/beta hydrolase fold domain-containing protein n=1 Tax=Sneathiella litorea TaxID=2606216 RepID=A0A6L8W9Z0_9PROT|nr:alpha/beta hydrolase [Sneathiella litorea]MZR31539.1 alpha/beta hydrolase fold domain-containing protein [Sneathiella litorea]